MTGGGINVGMTTTGAAEILNLQRLGGDWVWLSY